VNAAPEAEWLTLSDVAELLRVSAPTVRKAVREQGLPALKLGERVWRFKRVDVEAWVERMKKGSAA
jgi:excisionase family DNA binding protein